MTFCVSFSKCQSVLLASGKEEVVALNLKEVRGRRRSRREAAQPADVWGRVLLN